MVNVFEYHAELKELVASLYARKKKTDENIKMLLADKGTEFNSYILQEVETSVNLSIELKRRTAKLLAVEAKLKEAEAAKADLARDYNEFLGVVNGQIRNYDGLQADDIMQRVVKAMKVSVANYEKRIDLKIDEADKI